VEIDGGEKEGDEDISIGSMEKRGIRRARSLEKWVWMKGGSPKEGGGWHAFPMRGGGESTRTMCREDKGGVGREEREKNMGKEQYHSLRFLSQSQVGKKGAYEGELVHRCRQRKN